jgi:hypothetical protein
VPRRSIGITKEHVLKKSWKVLVQPRARAVRDDVLARRDNHKPKEGGERSQRCRGFGNWRQALKMFAAKKTFHFGDRVLRATAPHLVELVRVEGFRC